MAEHAKFSIALEPFAFWPRLKENEIETCHHYELGPAIARAEEAFKQKHGLTEIDLDAPAEFVTDRVLAIRHHWKEQGFSTTVSRSTTWTRHPAARTLVLYPEWPRLPYLAIDLPTRLQRIEELQAPLEWAPSDAYVRQLAARLSLPCAEVVQLLQRVSVLEYVPQHAETQIRRGVDAWSQLQDRLRELATLNKERLIPAEAKK